MKLKYILPLLLLLPVFSACNQSDDVIEIFTGKTWKLTNIFDSKGHVCIDEYFLTVSPDVKQESFKKWNQKGNLTINFTGVEVDDGITGTYNGRAINSTISGNWQADGKNNSFFTSGQAEPGSGEDILGKVYIKALINAYKYQGDTAGNLTIYFEDKERKDKRYLLFHESNE